jgi:hypothetical protein
LIAIKDAGFDHSRQPGGGDAEAARPPKVGRRQLDLMLFERNERQRALAQRADKIMEGIHVHLFSDPALREW